MRIVSYLLGGLLVVVACSGSESSSDDDDDGVGAGTTTSATGTGGGSAGSATVAQACDGLSNWYTVCVYEGEPPSPFDHARCVATEPCFRQVYRDEAEQAMLDCYALAACQPSCAEQLTTVPQQSHLDHQTRCADFATQCGSDGGDICRSSVVGFDAAFLDALAPCFTGGCSGFDDCVNEQSEAFLATCGGDMYWWW